MSLTDDINAGEWKFTPEVAAEFDKHVAQSVPHYDEQQKMIAELSDWLAPDGAVIADLGASTATTVAAIADRHPSRTFHAHLYDVESHMLAAARDKLADYENVRAKYHANTITAPLAHSGADLTIASLTLQFLADDKRLDALRYARHASRRGAGIIIVEKVYQDNPYWQDIATDLTQERKTANGLSAQEVRDKQAAIRGVLRPHSTRGLIDEMKETGWGQIDEVFRWHNWTMFAARAA